MKRKMINSLIMFVTVAFSFLLISEKNTVTSSVSNALGMCGDILIPSLFPFMVTASFALDSGVSDVKGKIIPVMMNKIFRLPGVCFPVLIFGFVGGYPVGARVVSGLYEKGKISSSDAVHLLSFCVNAGPAFVISVAGGMLTGAASAGLIIFASVCISSLAVGLVYSMLKKSDACHVYELPDKKVSFSQCLVQSVNSACNGILSVCGWVLVFSAFSAIVRQMFDNEKTVLIYDSIAEVTTGITSAAKSGGLPMVAACISFGGLSVMCQLIPYIKKCGMKISEYLLFRIINSILSFVVCRILISVFDLTVTVYSGMQPAIHFAPASAALLIMCAVLMSDILRIRQTHGLF